MGVSDVRCESLRTIPFLEPCVWSGSSTKVLAVISREIVGGMRG